MELVYFVVSAISAVSVGNYVKLIEGHTQSTVPVRALQLKESSSSAFPIETNSSHPCVRFCKNGYESRSFPVD